MYEETEAIGAGPVPEGTTKTGESTGPSGGPGMLGDWLRREPETVSALLAEVLANPWGHMSPSVYETARLVRSAPWLEGHRARCQFLLDSQHPDGTWGSPDGYDLVPTLSATEALLHEMHESNRPDRMDAPPGDLLAGAATRGLRALSQRLGPAGRAATAPDTIAAEFVIPWLVEEINSQGDGPSHQPRPAAALGLPRGVDDGILTRLRAAALAGRPLPEKLWHTLEVLGPQAAGAPGVRPVGGAVGSSPAATAAWLSGRVPASDDPSAVLLSRTQARAGGPVPGVVSIATFERAWVLGWLLDGNVPLRVPAKLLASLESSLGERGAAAGPGLPEDSDDTSAVLHALALAGRGAPPGSLWAFEAGAYFLCFHGEHTPSTSTNAHVLEALLSGAEDHEPARRRAAVRKVEDWLLSEQNQDGSWYDKWHASRYYATMCCAVALARGRHPGTSAALLRAQRWVLEAQRADGSWGRWDGTTEETAYALQILLRSRPGAMPRGASLAVARGCAYLLRNQYDDDFPPLWHDKDLYSPVAVVKAARIAALHTAATRQDLAPELARAIPQDTAARMVALT